MKKIIRRASLYSAILCGIVLSTDIQASPIFDIFTQQKSVTVPRAGFAIISYTVWNESGIQMDNMSYTAPQYTKGIADSSCLTSPKLPVNGLCFYNLLLQAPGLPGTFQLDVTKVCGFNGLYCSVPTPENRPYITVQ